MLVTSSAFVEGKYKRSTLNHIPLLPQQGSGSDFSVPGFLPEGGSELLSSSVFAAFLDQQSVWNIKIFPLGCATKNGSPTIRVQSQKPSPSRYQVQMKLSLLTSKIIHRYIYILLFLKMHAYITYLQDIENMK